MSEALSREAWIAVEKDTGFEGLTEWAIATGKIPKENDKNVE